MTDALFPPVQPFKTFRLPVSNVHTLYVEQIGNPRGIPCVFLHGGPGGGIDAAYRQFFDPKLYHVVLFDQRGCGQSTPFAELGENTTWDLVADIERIRTHIGIEKWMVFGGSWGSTLALAYAETHPERVTGLILRGIFLLRQEELDWFYGGDGTAKQFPDLYETFTNVLRDVGVHPTRANIIPSYYELLTHNDRTIRLKAAKAWSVWEAATSRLLYDGERVSKAAQDQFAEAFARIECHYFVNKGFLEEDDQLVRHAGRLKHIPGFIVHGRYDMVCQPSSAWDLHKAWPESKLVWAPDAGHSLMEPAIMQACVRATKMFAAHGGFANI